MRPHNRLPPLQVAAPASRRGCRRRNKQRLAHNLGAPSVACCAVASLAEASPLRRCGGGFIFGDRLPSAGRATQCLFAPLRVEASDGEPIGPPLLRLIFSTFRPASRSFCLLAQRHCRVRRARPADRSSLGGGCGGAASRATATPTRDSLPLGNETALSGAQSSKVGNRREGNCLRVAATATAQPSGANKAADKTDRLIGG